jgi:hypothetical protein
MSETLKVRTETAAHVTISSALVMLFKSDGITPVGGGNTSASGYITFTVSSVGDYAMTAYKPRTSFADAMARVEHIVAPSVNTATLTGVVHAVSDCSPVPSCLVYGYVCGPSGAHSQDATVIVESRSPGSRNSFLDGDGTGVDSEQVAFTSERSELRTDILGYWEVRLAVGSMVRVHIQDSGVNKTFRVPNAPMASFADIHTELSNEANDMASDYPHGTAFGGI